MSKLVSQLLGESVKKVVCRVTISSADPAQPLSPRLAGEIPDFIHDAIGEKFSDLNLDVKVEDLGG